MEHTVSRKNKWCYSTGCIGRDMTYTLVSMFLLTYVQYTTNLTDFQFSILVAGMVLCRVWDAINDPMMGTIITNTKSKFGKYRPWILIGAITNAIFLVLLFIVRPGSDIESAKNWWYVGIFILLYLFWGMTFTMNDVSFWSLLPALAKEKKERDNLTTMLAVFASVGAFAAGGLVPILTTGNAIAAYRVIAIVFAIIFVLCQVMVFFCVKEEEPKETQEKINLKKMFKLIFSNKQLVWMALVVLSYSLGSALLNALGQNFFYVEFGYSGNKMFLFTVIYAVGTLISQGAYGFLAAKFKRSMLTKLSMIILILGYALFFAVAVLPFGQDLSTFKFVLLCITGILVFAGQGIFYMAMLVMLANTIEYDEWKTGVRNESIIFSVRPFMVKLAGAIQQLIVLGVLLLTGVKAVSDKIAKLEMQKVTNQLTEEAVKIEASNLLSGVDYWQKFGLAASMTLIPIALFVVCYIVVKKKYIIDEELYETMIKEIAERKTNNLETE